MLRRALLLLLAILSTGAVFAQHPFYTQLLEQGKNAMSLKNWTVADRYLEIAAFGLLDEEELLADAYMRLALVNEQLGDKARSLNFVAKVKRIQQNNPHQPQHQPDDIWNQYQILAGLKAPPPPPIPAI